MIRCVIGLVVLVGLLSGCAGKPSPGAPKPPIAAAALDKALLTPDEMNAVTGTTMTAYPASDAMNDHRDILQNRNCLAIWQPNEAVIYADTGQTGSRRQVLRAPDTDQWTDRVAQSVVAFESAQAARAFISESADRWSKCTNHRLNITVNDQHLPTWQSGDLNKTDTQIAMPVTRGSGDQQRSCQRILAVDNNVIIDVDACSRQESGQAGTIVEKIEAKLAR